MMKSNNSGRRESVPPGGEEEKKMKMKMNKKLLGSLILGVMLCTPLTGARAADLTGGAIYGEGDSYSFDPSIVTKVETADGNTFTYDFHGDSQLVVDNDSADRDGIFIRGPSSAVSKIAIENQLDINVQKEGKCAALTGITIYNGGTTQERIIDRSAGGNITIESKNGSNSPFDIILDGASIASSKDSQIWLGDSDIAVRAVDAESGVYMHGLYIADDAGNGGTGNEIHMGNGTIDIIGNVAAGQSNETQGIGMIVRDANTIETGDVSVNVNMTGNQNTGVMMNCGIEADLGGKVITQNGDVTVHGKDGQAVYSYGIYAYGGEIEKTGGNIKAIAEGEGNLYTYGVLANEGSIDVGIADVASQAIGGSTVQSMALVAMGKSSISYAGGTITATADNDKATVRAVYALDTADININKDTNNTVVITGDVNTTDAGKVYLNLNTADSVLNGRVSDANGTFNLENGAQWNVLGKSTVNTFHMKNGIINMDRNYDVNIASYSGSGTIFFLAEDQAADGVANFENVGNVEIKEAEAGSSVTLGIANDKIDTLDIGKTEESLNALANKISYTANDGNLIGKAVIREGLITPEASGELVFSTTGSSVTNITGGNRTTETMYAMKNLAATAIVAWRQEDSTLSQRLGELRESTGGQGIWVRMSRGEFEYSGEYKNQYNFFQLGYDWAADNWHYGVAVSHNDGETAYTYGSGENRSTSLSLYGTWLGDAGHYADIVLKQGRLSNDFDVYTGAGHTSGDYDAWGTSLSGEYGRKFVLEDDWYITPQAQLTLMRIGGENYGTNNGISVRQDTLYSAVGRLGFEVGKKVDDKGSVYAKASVLHDFAGNADTYLAYNGFTNSYSQDLSDTWFEAGIGFNYKISDSSYVYADVMRTFGGDVETPWQWNIGMRWSC